MQPDPWVSVDSRGLGCHLEGRIIEEPLEQLVKGLSVRMQRASFRFPHFQGAQGITQPRDEEARVERFV